MDQQPTLLLFAAAGGPSEIEQAVAGAQWAVAVETIEKALRSGRCERVIVATSAAGLIAQLDHLPVIVERDAEPFHFGRQLRDLIRRHGIRRPLYVGGGSAALFGAVELADLCRRLAGAQRAVFPNNFWSTDFAGFVPGDTIERIEPPAIDNNLAFLLNRSAGLPEMSLPHSAATQFDIDTPTDLLILSLHHQVGPRARAYLDALDLETTRLRTLMRMLTDDQAEVLIAGRVGSATWLHLEQDTACRVRLFSEERGMRASGREERGEVRSLLGFYLQRCDPRGLFQALAALGDAAIIDSRVIFAHLGLNLSAPDRFHSDLLQAERIADPLAREFTAAAREAPIPVVLGGHSLVSGGLWALIDAAWHEHDRQAGRSSR